MIIKLGGPNGSGKTTFAREFMKQWKFTPVTNERGKITQYTAAASVGKFKQVVVLGSYEAVCGGMDGVSDKNVRIAMIKEHMNNKQRLTLFEGIMTGLTYGEIGVLSETDKQPWIYAFLDTPFEVCVERVLARRAEKGNDKPFDAEKNLRRRMREVQSVANRAKLFGHRVYWVDYKQTPKQQVTALLKALTK